MNQQDVDLFYRCLVSENDCSSMHLSSIQANIESVGKGAVRNRKSVS